jgi:hypothetical protein
MSSESHRQFLERAALREAQRALDRSGSTRISRDDIGSLKIQTVEPWKRVVVGIIATGLGGGGFALLSEIRWLGVTCIVAGFLLLLVAILGRRKAIDSLVDSVNLLDFVCAVVDAIDV